MLARSILITDLSVPAREEVIFKFCQIWVMIKHASFWSGILERFHFDFFQEMVAEVVIFVG